MIVSCPYCATRFNLEPTRLAGPNPMLKCSRCKHVFPAPRPKKQAPSPAPSKSSPEESSLTLPFDESGWKDEPQPGPGHDLTITEHEEQYTLGADTSSDDLVIPASAAAERDTTPARTERPATRGASTTPAKTPPPASLEVEPDAPTAALEFDDDEEDVETHDIDDPDDPSEPAPPPRSRSGAARRRGRSARQPPRDHERGKVWAILIFLAAVLGTYATLTRALFASPQLCDRLLTRVPLIGFLGDERLLTRKVALSDVVGTYQRIKDGKQVFVITGKAVNTAPMALHDVQIAGKLFGDQGQELAEKVIFCGKSITVKMLKDMTQPEISILQSIRPVKGFAIEPGESSPFVIVFMDPPRQAREFTTKVAGVQRHA